jgi:hypothetical protein
MSTAKVLPFPGVVHHKISGPSRGLATHGEEREPSPGSAWPWIIFSGEPRGEAMLSRWMTGADVMRELDWAPFELRRAMLDREGLRPVEQEHGTKWSVLLNPCLVCDGDPRSYSHAPYYQCTLPRRIGAKDCDRTDTMSERLEAARFLRADVEQYARKSKLSMRSETEAIHRAFAFLAEKASSRLAVPRELADLAASAPPSPLDREEAAPDREETPQEMVARMKREGRHTDEEIARALATTFEGLPDATIGELLPANPRQTISYSGKQTRGRRLLGKK